MVLSGRSAVQDLPDYFGGDDVSHLAHNWNRGCWKISDIVKILTPQQIYSYEGTSFGRYSSKAKQKMKRLLTGLLVNVA
ncbi:hypothetical protein TNCV_632961 [Trichonephila clavipes]|nr:hypothetical protein TNCV_632961 [Trichonephila clavipes]